MEKSLLRKHFLAVRRGITENDPQTSEALCRAVSLWLSDKYFRCIGFYAPFRGEPDITPAVVAALSCGRASITVSSRMRNTRQSRRGALAHDGVGVVDIPAGTVRGTARD